MAERLLNGNDYSMRLSKQTAKGAIDATPAFDVVRRTGGKARKQTSYVQSSEVKTNRQASQNIKDSTSLMADIESEMTKQNIAYLQYAIQGVETTLIDLTDTDISADANGFADATGTGFSALTAGDYVFVSGYGNTLLNQAYRVDVVNGGGADIETTPPPPAIDAGGDTVNVLSYRTTSASTIPYFTGQTQVVDASKAGSIDYFTVFDGYINSASFEIGETGVVSSSMAMLFEQEQPGTAIISGQTDVTDTSNVLSAINNVVKFWVDGVDSDCTIKSMGFEFSNNFSEDKAAGCVGSSYANGQMTLSGSVAARLPIDNPMLYRDKYNNGTAVELAAELLHTGTDTTIVSIGKAIVTEHEIPDGSNVTANSEMTYTAEEDSRGYTTVIYRNWQ